jgi:hypothetical protein
VWVNINEREQNDIIKYLNLALKNSNVPDIIKIILNLVEFIERCDVIYFLPLDYKLLAEKAFQVKAYAKAIHYIEEQFHAVMASSSTINSANLAGLYNGIGGVSGAGGGSSITCKTITSSMISMSRQQQQQTLIYLLEQLVTLNHELQQTEGAIGVLDYSSKYLKSLDSQTRVKIRWYEKLHQWQKAITIYEKELSTETPTLGNLLSGQGSLNFPVTETSRLTENRLELLMGRLRCLKGLGDWQRLNISCNDLLRILNGIEPASSSLTAANSNKSFHTRQGSLMPSPSTPNIENIVVINSNSNLAVASALRNPDLDQNSFLHQLSASQRNELKEEICEIGAAACWGLGDWDQMRTYARSIPENVYEGSLYSCVLSLTSFINNSGGGSENEPLSIQRLIEKTRDLLDGDLTSMASQSYERSYQGKP